METIFCMNIDRTNQIKHADILHVFYVAMSTLSRRFSCGSETPSVPVSCDPRAGEGSLWSGFETGPEWLGITLQPSSSGTHPPNSALIGYAMEGAFFISAQLSTEMAAVKVHVSLRGCQRTLYNWRKAGVLKSGM